MYLYDLDRYVMWYDNDHRKFFILTQRGAVAGANALSSVQERSILCAWLLVQAYSMRRKRSNSMRICSNGHRRCHSKSCATRELAEGVGKSRKQMTHQTQLNTVKQYLYKCIKHIRKDTKHVPYPNIWSQEGCANPWRRHGLGCVARRYATPDLPHAVTHFEYVEYVESVQLKHKAKHKAKYKAVLSWGWTRFAPRARVRWNLLRAQTPRIRTVRTT